MCVRSMSRPLRQCFLVLGRSLCASAPPVAPAAEECCGRGCERCVWTYYYEALTKYQAGANNAGAAAPVDAAAAAASASLDALSQLERKLHDQQ